MITLEEMVKKQIHNSELISIIIPVYKVEKYLNKCVESVVNQTYKNLEIILVDDGSPDNCPNMCDDWIKKDSRIKVIHQKNGGLSVARNTGIDTVKGEYLCFVDSDDYVDGNYVKELYEAIKSNNADMAICEVLDVDEFGNALEKYNCRKKIENGIYSNIQIMSRWIDNPILTYAVAWNKLYKRELFNELRYKAGKINEDEFIIHRLFANCNKIACINKPLYYYLRRNDSIMGTDFSIRRFDYIEALEDRIKLFQKISMYEFVIKTKCRLLLSIASLCYLFDCSKGIKIEDKNLFQSKLNPKFKLLYKSYLKEIIQSKSISFKDKIIVFFYSISPSFVKCFRKISKTIRKTIN